MHIKLIKVGREGREIHSFVRVKIWFNLQRRKKKWI